jgi:uncharacterized membrane protein YkvA (DUF1232 family)
MMGFRFGRRPRTPGARGALTSVIRQLPAFLGLLLRLFRDGRVSKVDKALVAMVIAYILTPVDLIPDFLGIVGLTDDVYLLGLALSRMVGRAGPEVLMEHWRGPAAALPLLLERIEDIGALLPGRVRRLLRRKVPKR